MVGDDQVADLSHRRVHMRHRRMAIEIVFHQDVIISRTSDQLLQSLI